MMKIKRLEPVPMRFFTIFHLCYNILIADQRAPITNIPSKIDGAVIVASHLTCGYS